MRALLSRLGLSNVAALTVIQGSNALVPLLIVPFAVLTVGTDVYAQVATTEALSALVLATVLYSFDVDGVALIAQSERGSERAFQGEVFSAVLTARLLLFAVAAPLGIAIYRLAGGDGVLLLAYWLLVPLGHAFHAYWFYQATERSLPAAIFTSVGRLASLAVIFGLVRGPEDASLIPLAIGGSFLITGVASTLYIVTVLQVPVRAASLASISRNLAAGKEVFAGNIAVSLYREMNVVILGIVGAPAASVSTYSLVEKSVKVLQAIARPLNQLYFPKVLRALSGVPAPDRGAARIIGRYTLPQLIVGVLLIALVPPSFAIAVPLVPQMHALAKLPDLATMAAVMAPAMLFGIANFMYGTAGLNALRQRGYLFLAIMATGAANVATCLGLSLTFGAIGASVCFLLAEAMLFGLIMLRYLRAASASRVSTEHA